VVPIDRALIVADQLSAAELAWINAYHARVRDVLMADADPATSKWLARATAPIKA
jgi:Xaa-Pro aminopeptidase